MHRVIRYFKLYKNINININIQFKSETITIDGINCDIRIAEPYFCTTMDSGKGFKMDNYHF